MSYIVTAKQNKKILQKIYSARHIAFNGSGGGRDDFAQGKSEAVDIENKFNVFNINLQSLI